MDTGK